MRVDDIVAKCRPLTIHELSLLLTILADMYDYKMEKKFQKEKLRRKNEVKRCST